MMTLTDPEARTLRAIAHEGPLFRCGPTWFRDLDGPALRRLPGGDLGHVHPSTVEALERRGLVAVTAEAVTLTEAGRAWMAEDAAARRVDWPTTLREGAALAGLFVVLGLWSVVGHALIG